MGNGVSRRGDVALGILGIVFLAGWIIARIQFNYEMNKDRAHRIDYAEVR